MYPNLPMKTYGAVMFGAVGKFILSQKFLLKLKLLKVTSARKLFVAIL